MSWAFFGLFVPLVACGDAENGGGGGGEGGANSTATGAPATSGTTGTGSTGTVGTTSTGAGGDTSGLVPVFVAQGHLGRLMVSCDDGHTFVANQSADDNEECWGPDGVPDCDHSPWA